jgi:uncharacterized membrane protein
MARVRNRRSMMRFVGGSGMQRFVTTVLGYAAEMGVFFVAAAALTVGALALR